MARDAYATERLVYGDAAADGMMQFDIYELITGCGETVREDPTGDAAGIFWAIKFIDQLAAFAGE